MSDKAVFLDRDNTLIEDPGYINHPDQVKLLDGATEAIIELKDLGYKLIVVSNQSAVARGIVTEKVLTEIHDRIKQLLAEKGAYLDQIYYCPYHPDGVVPKYRRESESRKPNPGMLLTAAQEMDIDLSQSWLIGDGYRDIEAGLRTGCKTILIKHSWDYKQAQPGDPKPHYNAVNIKEATNIIKKFHRSSGDVKNQAQSAPPAPIEITSQSEEQSHVSEPPEPETNLPPASINPIDQQEAKLQQQQSGSDSSQRSLPATARGAVTSAEQERDGLEYVIGVLNGILEQLKSMQRTSMFDEFSIMKMMAGIVQIVVLFCLLLTIWFLMSPTGHSNSVLISLGFAMVLQLMSLTFYIMAGRK